MSLDGLYLANNYSNLTAWVFPLGASINPGQFKLIFADGQTNLSTLAELHTSFTLSSMSGSLALSRLYNSQPQVLDFINYTNLGLNHSYGSFPDGQSFYRQEFFFATPGATNDGSSAPLSVSINEWMAANTNTIRDPVTGKFNDWFELYNYGTNTVNLAGYYLTDDLTNKFKFLIPSGYSIPPRGFLLVWADNKATNGTPDLHVTFKMDKAGESLGLFGADGRPVDYVSYGPQSDDISQGRYPDGGPNIYFMVVPTPQTNNIFNTAPLLSPIPDKNVLLGQTLSFFASATDTDQPPQMLTFSLGPGAPLGAAVNPFNGQFTLKPPSAPSTNSARVVVADNGTPSLSDSQSFMITVFPPPQLLNLTRTGNQFSFSWLGVPGQTYQPEYKDDLGTASWTTLGPPLPGMGTSLSLTNTISDSPQRFFRIRVLP